MYRDLIIMTKSDKHGGFCVVGIDTTDGNFICSNYKCTNLFQF